MSQSSRPTRAPRCVSAQARFTEQVDLPTPPLPLAMAMIRFTPETLPWLAKGFPGAAAPAAGWRTSTRTWLTPGRFFRRRSLSALICCAASALAEVNCIVTVTTPLAAAISLTRPNETMSREKPGYLTDFNASKTVSCESIRPLDCQFFTRKQASVTADDRHHGPKCYNHNSWTDQFTSVCNPLATRYLPRLARTR